ncbi:hypothetical protein AMATHDRAFT_5478 [Amanita thiersii Skay4041]|uniref:Uncharacterized protein n=1 Tax=Amanita thiersii Skay4041 TaxID=703135 RepID=A0A2A9NCQ0_9AGAR|nr:hypothetical protein AMATHDRAFT_5478 [Amanita thiersii Skay4041]
MAHKTHYKSHYNPCITTGASHRSTTLQEHSRLQRINLNSDAMSLISRLRRSKEAPQDAEHPYVYITRSAQPPVLCRPEFVTLLDLGMERQISAVLHTHSYRSLKTKLPVFEEVLSTTTVKECSEALLFLSWPNTTTT